MTINLTPELRQQLRVAAVADRKRGAEMLLSPAIILALLDAFEVAETLIASKQQGYDDLHRMVSGSGDIWTKVDQCLARLAARDAALTTLRALLSAEGAIRQHGYLRHTAHCAFDQGNRDHSKGYRGAPPDDDECTCHMHHIDAALKAEEVVLP